MKKKPKMEKVPEGFVLVVWHEAKWRSPEDGRWHGMNPLRLAVKATPALARKLGRALRKGGAS